MSTATVTCLPELAVFDLDACLWDQEMFEMSEMPTDPIQGELGNAGEGRSPMAHHANLGLGPGHCSTRQKNILVWRLSM
eukprot:8848586-Pyramimonas_sp.AAC.1